MDCLGRIIDNRGIHADVNKITQILEWRSPRSYHDVQQFLGLIQYLQYFLPNIPMFTKPLLPMIQNGHEFVWHPIHKKVFQYPLDHPSTTSEHRDDLNVAGILGSLSTSLAQVLSNADSFLKSIREGYSEDSLFLKIKE